MTAQLRFAILLLAGLAAGPIIVTGGAEVSTAQRAPDLATLDRTIERIYGTADFTPAAFSQTEWFDGGRRFVALEPSDDGQGRERDRHPSGSRSHQAPPTRAATASNASSTEIRSIPSGRYSTE